MQHLAHGCQKCHIAGKVARCGLQGEWSAFCFWFCFDVFLLLFGLGDVRTGGTHEVIAAVADSKVVKFLKGNAALALAYVARDGVVDGAVRDHQRALLANALAVHFHTDDGKN